MRNHIRERRKALGLRQEDLANRLGVTRQTINAVENEKYNPTLGLAMRLALLLQTPVEELFILEVCGKLDKKHDKENGVVTI
jgi:putative transcriptional regulator